METPLPALEVTVPLETEVVRAHRSLVTGTTFQEEAGIVVTMDVRRMRWRTVLGLPRGTVVHWSDVRTIDIKELSPVLWPLHYRLTYGDGWYKGRDGVRHGFAVQPHLPHIDLDRQCTTVALRAAVLLAVMAGLGLRSVCWLMKMLFNMEVSKSALDRWVKTCAGHLPDGAGMAKVLAKDLPITECHFDEIFPIGRRPKPCTMVVRDEHGRIFATKMLTERTVEKVSEFLTEVKSWGIDLKVFYIDGCEAYRAAIPLVYPNAVIQYDNFHVIQNIFRKLWKTVVARRKDIKARGEEAETPAYSVKLLGLAQRIWEGRWLFFKRDDNLSKEERTEMLSLLEADTVLDRVRGFVLGIWGVFENGQTAEDARRKLTAMWFRPEVIEGSAFYKALAFVEGRFDDMVAFMRHPGVQRNSLAETGIRCLRRLERGHDGFRGEQGMDCYVRLYQAIKYCRWTVHRTDDGLGLLPDISPSAAGPPT